MPTIYGTDGDDNLESASPTGDIVNGYGGNDTLSGFGSGNDLIFGGDGNDELSGGLEHDLLYGGNGDDTLRNEFDAPGLGQYGGAGNDTCYMVAGTYADGGADDDTFYLMGDMGSVGAKIIGGAGHDRFDFTQGDPGGIVDLAAGNVYFGAGANQPGMGSISGVEDVLAGGGDDTLIGSNAANMLDGGWGADKIGGGGGADTLLGGKGADIFMWTALSESTTAARDNVSDFEDGVDKLSIKLAGGPALTFVGDHAFTGGRQVSVHTQPGHGGDVTIVDVNTDRNYHTAEMSFQLDGHHDLKASDFVF